MRASIAKRQRQKKEEDEKKCKQKEQAIIAKVNCLKCFTVLQEEQQEKQTCTGEWVRKK